MATTPRGIWTQDDSTAYNPPVDAAATAQSIEDGDIGKAANSYTGTSVQRNAFTTAREGVLWSDTNGANGLYKRVAGTWVRIDAPATARGTVSITTSASAGGTAAITFPAGTFLAPPLVMLTKQSAGGAKYIPYATSVTANGATVGVYTGDGTAGSQTVVVGWMAVAV